MQELNEANEQLKALMCGCTFHTYCLNAYCAQLNLGALSCRCPNCRTNADSIATAEAALMSETAVDLVGGVNSPVQIGAISGAGSADQAAGGGVAASEAEGDVDVAAADAGAAAAGGSAAGVGAVAPGAVAPGDAASAPAVAPGAVAQVDAASAPAVAPAATVAVASPAQATGPARATGNTSTAVGYFPWVADGMYCSSCGTSLVKQKCRLVNKTKALWRCSVCSTKMVQLSRTFGSWPTPSFAALSDAEQKNFFESVKHAKKLDDVKRVATEYMSNFEQHRKYYQDGGEFLPLGVWQARGFDVIAIERNAEAHDKVLHPVLGLTYRVAILSTGRSGESGTSRRSEVRVDEGDTQSAAPPAPVQAQIAAPRKDDSSDSSSDKGANKDRRERKKAAKKARKEKHAAKKAAYKAKETERKRKLQENADQNIADKRKCFALQIIAKVEPVVEAMATDMSQPWVVSLPDSVVGAARGALSKLSDAEKLARLVVADATAPLPFTSMNEIQGMIKCAKNANTIVSTMLASIERLGRV